MLPINKIYNMDCLEGMKKIPDGSVDMILCDLPYGTVKNMAIDGWKNKGESCTWDNKLDIEKLFIEYERVCRENANIILFSQEPYTSELRSYKAENIEFAYPLIWKKDHFANALIAKKAPLSYFEDLSVFYKKYDVRNLNPLREYSSDLIEWIGINKKQIIDIIGQKADHFFRIDSAQFKLCTKKTYDEMIDKFKLSKWDKFKTFTELQKINEKYQRVFNLPEGKKFIGNVLEFKKDYQGLHPTQKPVALLEFLINTYSNENEVILDNCMGSGTTAIACINTNRNFIGFEISKEYCDIANKRISEHHEQLKMVGD